MTNHDIARIPQTTLVKVIPRAPGAQTNNAPPRPMPPPALDIPAPPSPVFIAAPPGHVNLTDPLPDRSSSYIAERVAKDDPAVKNLVQTQNQTTI